MTRQTTNAVYAAIADLLQMTPERFAATLDGLAISTEVIDDALGDISRSTAIAIALRDGYMIRATHTYWLLLPEAFDCDGEYLPAGVRDRRAESARDVWRVVIAA